MYQTPTNHKSADTMKQFPRKSIAEKEPNKKSIAIPINYREIHVTGQLFDPTIVNTPPSEFIDQLKDRLQIYFSS